MTKQEPTTGQLADSGTTLYRDQRPTIHSLLFAWYAVEGRHQLPWRHTHDPYAILVAEIMLQQTQVERVVPKYSAFLKRFPAFAALAEAPTAEVIRAWAGLGYNLRAVRLQEIARQVAGSFAGALPATIEELLTLKGIGRYTAGAIACFAFGLPVATVDTNIRRVLWRVFRGIEPREWPTGDRAAREALALATWALPLQDAYGWQQALMDLGATICFRRHPLCGQCPLASCCEAYASSRYTRPDEPKERLVAEARADYSVGDAKPVGQLAPGKKPEPFVESSRYFRGRVVEALRALAPGESLTLSELGRTIRPHFTPEDPEQATWLYGIVQRLARDGLVALSAAERDPEQESRLDIGKLCIALP